MKFIDNLIGPGYYYLYMPNALKRLRLEMDEGGIAADEILDQTSPDIFYGMECPHSRNLDRGNDRFGQGLPPKLSDSVRMRTELLKFDGENCFSLHAHFSLFPELTEYLIPDLLYGEDERIDEERQRMGEELARKKVSRRFVKMPGQDLDDDFGYLDSWNDNPGRTLLERLNYELFEGRTRFELVFPSKIHSMATPYQVTEFRELVIAGYKKECEEALIIARPEFLEVIKNF